MVVQAKDSYLIYAPSAIPPPETRFYRRIESVIQDSGAIVDHDGFKRVRDAR